MHANHHVRSQQRRTLRQIRTTDAYAFFDLLTGEGDPGSGRIAVAGPS